MVDFLRTPKEIDYSFASTLATVRTVSRPAAVEPETKNWTWVLERPCPDCGFEASSFAVGTIAAALDDNARRWEAGLARRGVTDRTLTA